MLDVFKATILLALVLVFINFILKELKESKEIIRLFSSIVVISYIVTIVLFLACSITISATEDTKQANEIVIEL